MTTVVVIVAFTAWATYVTLSARQSVRDAHRQSAVNTQVLADAVAAVTKAVGESVQTAMAPPVTTALHVTPDSLAAQAVEQGWVENTADMADDVDPTDGNLWLSRDRTDVVFATNDQLPHGISFPPPKGPS